MLYKLTNQNMQTLNGFQYKLGVPAKPHPYYHGTMQPGTGRMCGPGWLHAYQDPLVGIAMNPVDANIDNPRLFKAEGEAEAFAHVMKVGTTELTLTEELPAPVVTLEQRITFAILLVDRAAAPQEFCRWMDEWLAWENRNDYHKWEWSYMYDVGLRIQLAAKFMVRSLGGNSGDYDACLSIYKSVSCNPRVDGRLPELIRKAGELCGASPPGANNAHMSQRSRVSEQAL